MAVLLFGMVMITKRCPYFGEKAQIVSSPDRRGNYKVQVSNSLETFKLERKDFVVLSAKRARKKRNS